MCLQSMQMKWMEPLTLKSARRVNAVFRNSVNSSVLISPQAIANSRCFTLPSPDTFPAIGTLYGGSVNTK